MAGRLYAGTSGFAYPDWAPRFYPPALLGAALLRHYAVRLTAVELNSTFYRRPSPTTVAAWLEATPEPFRFCVKAQRGGSYRALHGDAPAAVAWLTAPYRLFGARLGAVLLQVAGAMTRDDEALGRVLDAWPAAVPLALELEHASWMDDAVLDLLRVHRVALVATDRDDLPEPDLRLTGSLLYLRLRRARYTQAALARWVQRLRPFLDTGTDAYVFVRHDSDGASALAAEALLALGAAPVVRPVRRGRSAGGGSRWERKDGVALPGDRDGASHAGLLVARDGAEDLVGPRCQVQGERLAGARRV